MVHIRWIFMVVTLVLLSACNLRSEPQEAFNATIAPTSQSAPLYSATPSLPPTETTTSTPEVTFTPSAIPTETPTFTPEFSPTPSNTPLPSATLALLTLTPAIAQNAPATYVNPPADFSPNSGWSCDDFPCADDIDGFMQRIRVPAGFALEHVGRFPGQPMQITYGPDGRLYATVLENGTRNGAVYVMNADGTAIAYSPTFVSPLGLAFQPGTDVLYVSARVAPASIGRLWQIQSDGKITYLPMELPCCYSLIDNQPNGLIFGPDGYLYMGVGSLTDHLEPADPRTNDYADLQPNEASILRIQPHTGELSVFASGIRNPYDLTFDSTGQLYATDNGMVEGAGDRVLSIMAGGHYGWPYWGARGCFECPPVPYDLTINDDLLRLPDYTLPRGLVAYTGTQFPANLWDNLFVALWNGTPNGQRIVRIDPRAITDPANFVPEPFVTGLIRPVDIVIAPDGSLVIADYVYGHIWRVRYTGG